MSKPYSDSTGATYIRASLALATTALTFAAALLPSGVLAQPFPEKTVQVIVPYTPGGLTDGLIRHVAAELNNKWKQTVVVQNKGGGGTTIGTAQVAQAQADGYTMLFTSTGFVTNQVLMKSLPYDSKSLTPIAMGATAPNVLYVNPSLPVKTIGELVAYGKAHPGELKFASTGNGSSTHLTAELLAAQASMPMLHVPYKGAGPALNDLLAGHVNAMFHFPASLALAKEGKLRALGVASKERLPNAPDLPTFEEAGIPGVISSSWFGLFVPADTPEAIKDQIHRDVNAVLELPKTREFAQGMGLTLTTMSRAEFAGFISNERDKWARVIKERNIKTQ